ncbi:MAG: triose-phosphate isomerase [Alphaproteobacteria bacterium]|nr:triose-phosphate isomerase [Alphaproteobacteria bacterium]MBR3661793.1 triose-phosphate isomerase [Alphaproteobacteria bacterium]
MVRKTLIAGNWKMNCLTQEGTQLAKEIAAKVKAEKFDCEFLICPPFTLLATIKKCLRGTKIALGAQDVHFAEKGAHTGDISPLMLTDLGCKYTIIGHSERRVDHQESNELINQKAVAAHKAGLNTVICIGETLEERENGRTIQVCQNEIFGSVPDDATAKNTVIAYEPIWAIGTGKTPTVADVQEVHSAVRKALAKKLGKSTADKMRILYGGSVKPSNAKELLALPDVDGALIGGASLKADDFIAIAQNAPK